MECDLGVGWWRSSSWPRPSVVDSASPLFGNPTGVYSVVLNSRLVHTLSASAAILVVRYATPSLHLDGGQNKNSINRHCGCQAKGLQCCLGCRG